MARTILLPAFGVFSLLTLSLLMCFSPARLRIAEKPILACATPAAMVPDADARLVFAATDCRVTYCRTIAVGDAVCSGSVH
jgi:hypothetical protein